MNRYSLIPFVLVAGCVSVRDFEPVANEAGLYRAVHPTVTPLADEPERVMRESDRRLVTSEADARRVLDATPSVPALMESARDQKCSVKTLYPAKVAQYRAEERLSAGDYARALEALAQAERICPDVYLISPQEYLRAVALSGLGRADEARAAARRFVDYAAAISPARFRQYEGPDVADVQKEFARDAACLAEYRARARAFVNGEAKLTWDEPARAPKFYPNNPYRPGGNRMSGWMILPAISYGEEYGANWGLAGLYSWGAHSISAALLLTESSGSYVSLRDRHSVYESPNRDLEVDVLVGGHTSKKLKISERQEAYYMPRRREVQVVETAFDPILGAGATYRLRPELGAAGQLTLTLNQLRNRVDLGHSLYGFYDLVEDLSLNAGWIESKPMVSLSLGFLHLGYNFSDREVRVLLHNILF